MARLVRNPFNICGAIVGHGFKRIAPVHIGEDSKLQRRGGCIKVKLGSAHLEERSAGSLRYGNHAFQGNVTGALVHKHIKVGLTGGFRADITIALEEEDTLLFAALGERMDPIISFTGGNHLPTKIGSHLETSSHTNVGSSIGRCRISIRTLLELELDIFFQIGQLFTGCTTFVRNDLCLEIRISADDIFTLLLLAGSKDKESG